MRLYRCYWELTVENLCLFWLMMKDDCCQKI